MPYPFVADLLARWRRPASASSTRLAKLRQLAAWHREFAEKTGNPHLRACHLEQAGILEAEAASIARDARAPHRERCP